MEVIIRSDGRLHFVVNHIKSNYNALIEYDNKLGTLLIKRNQLIGSIN